MHPTQNPTNANHRGPEPTRGAHPASQPHGRGGENHLPTPPAASPTSPTKRRTDRSRLLVVGVTTVAAASWWAILVPVAGLTLDARQGGVLQHVGAPAIMISTALITFAGWALLAILERFAIGARRAWTIVATISCLISLGSPLTGGVGLGAKLGLASFHLLVGALVILGLRRTALSAKERCYEDNRAA